MIVTDTTPQAYRIRLERDAAARLRRTAAEFRAGRVTHVPAGSAYAEHYAAECERQAAAATERANLLEGTW